VPIQLVRRETRTNRKKTSRRPYGRRTGLVRAPWVLPSAAGAHTCGMAHRTFGRFPSRPVSDGPDFAALPMTDTFDTVVLPHREAAYRLARWLMPGDDEVDDVVQEALLRAFRYFHTFAGENGRAWLLRIVRNACRDWCSGRSTTRTEPFDEERCAVDSAADPEALLLRSENAALIARAMDDLPGRHRELLAFRELEGLSYQEMADVMGIPMGTVMSGLSRARQAFRCALCNRLRECALR